MMKKIICATFIYGLTSLFAYGTEDKKLLNDRIQEVNRKIQELEKDPQHSETQLQQLVEEYNSLIQQREQTEIPQTDATDSVHPQPQALDDAIVKRLQNIEARLIAVEKNLSRIETHLGLPPLPSVDDQTPNIQETQPQKPDPDLAPVPHTILPPLPSVTIKQQDPHVEDHVATDRAEHTTNPNQQLSSALSIEQQYNQGMTFLKSQDLNDKKKAIDIFQDLINSAPDDMYAHKSYLHAGDAALACEQFESAEKFYEAAMLKPLQDTLIVDARLGYTESLARQNKTVFACKQIDFLKKQPMTDGQATRYQGLARRYCTPR